MKANEILKPCKTCNGTKKIVRTFTGSIGLESAWRPKGSLKCREDEIKDCPKCFDKQAHQGKKINREEDRIMTDEQLLDLHNDIRDGVSMIVAKDHYYEMEAIVKELEDIISEAGKIAQKKVFRVTDKLQLRRLLGVEK